MDLAPLGEPTVASCRAALETALQASRPQGPCGARLKQARNLVVAQAPVPGILTAQVGHTFRQQNFLE